MDDSKTFIKMCDCPEIQGQWKPSEGDLMASKACQTISFAGYTTDYRGQREFYPLRGTPAQYEHIWLPRQDQLQEMSGLHWREFDAACWQMVIHYGHGLETKEQAGSMVVMKEKYNKTWVGEKWSG